MLLATKLGLLMAPNSHRHCNMLAPVFQKAQGGSSLVVGVDGFCKSKDRAAALECISFLMANRAIVEGRIARAVRLDARRESLPETGEVSIFAATPIPTPVRESQEEREARELEELQRTLGESTLEVSPEDFLESNGF